MPLDEPQLERLLEQSEDLHSDAMAQSRVALSEMVELGHEQPTPAEPFTDSASLLAGIPKTGILAGAGLGAALLALLATPAFAGSSKDVQTLQTAAAIENLAVATYGVALTLDFIGGASANPVVKAFAMKTKDQHAEHAKAFNAAATSLGGKAQTKPDAVLLKVVNTAKPGLTGPGPVVDLAIELETGAASTYVANTAALANPKARSVTASVMGVEAQHIAILNAVKALVAGGAADLIALPPDASRLPAAAGSVGFPDAFFQTSAARPVSEGAVK
jgi:Ferritin-like domain